MSHLKQRNENICLNCDAIIHGRYCHKCGQENIELKENFWHLTTHLVADIFHYDSKFFTTLKYLLFKPGFLTKEYFNGRRMRYLHPIKMYVFTSAVFFILFFAFFQKSGSDDFSKNIIINEKRMSEIERMNDAEFAKFTAEVNKKADKDSLPMTREEFKQWVDTAIINKGKLTLNYRKYKSLQEYDSLVRSGIIKDNWFEQKVRRKEINLIEKYDGDERKIWKAISEKFVHLIPQMLFISLPIFALILQLLYVRRKKYFYVSHAIFTLHLYCATFLLILTSLILSAIWKGIGFSSSTIISIIFFLIVFYYGYKAMKNFYGQGRAKTLLKYCLLYILQFFVMLIVFVLFAIISAFAI